MSIDYSDLVGWPAEGGAVHHEPGYQGNAWRNTRWRERELARRRKRYAEARARGATWREAARFAHLGDKKGASAA